MEMSKSFNQAPSTIGFVWTGEFDLNTLRVDGEIFESGKEKLRIKKYPDMCGRGLNVHSSSIACANVRLTKVTSIQ